MTRQYNILGTEVSQKYQTGIKLYVLVTSEKASFKLL
jgi:hypothetical protein